MERQMLLKGLNSAALALFRALRISDELRLVWTDPSVSRIVKLPLAMIHYEAISL